MNLAVKFFTNYVAQLHKVLPLQCQETDVRRLMPLLIQRLKRALSNLQSCQENEQCSGTAFAPLQPTVNSFRNDGFTVNRFRNIFSSWCQPV